MPPLPLSVLSIMALAVATTACAFSPYSVEPSADRCPPPSGEFPPTACAVVTGTVQNLSGQPLTNRGVRIDSLIPSLGYQYTSNAATVDANGTFRVIVYRVNSAIRPTAPDTATIDVKLYAAPAPSAGAPMLVAAPVRMKFAPLAQPVEPTAVNLVVDVRR